jgi:hypothetical protein
MAKACKALKVCAVSVKVLVCMMFTFGKCWWVD